MPVSKNVFTPVDMQYHNIALETCKWALSTLQNLKFEQLDMQDSEIYNVSHKTPGYLSANTYIS